MSEAVAPNDPDESKQAKGGKARARALSPEQHSAKSRELAAARWKWPKATHEGQLEVGGITLDCAVLENGTAVISETKFMEKMGIYRSGALSTRRDAADETGTKAPLHLAFKNLKPFVEKHFGPDGPEPLKYRTQGGSVAHGIKAEVLPKICEVWLDARLDGVLGDTQKRIAEMADMLLRSFAHVGIVALVHEATGFQDERQRDYLQELLKEILSDKLRAWVKTFPIAYFKEICRLKGIPFRGDMRLPQYFGHLTNDVVYRRLAPTLLERLQQLNPIDEGQRKAKHFQWLSDESGHPKLLQHLGLVIGLAKVSKDWDSFKVLLDKAAPIIDPEKYPLFKHLDEKDDDEKSS